MIVMNVLPGATAWRWWPRVGGAVPARPVALGGVARRDERGGGGGADGPGVDGWPAVTVASWTAPTRPPPRAPRRISWRRRRPRMRGNVVCIDYTHPDAVNGNAEWYAAHGFAFVMGTTGGDRELLEATVANAGTHCVIAPNMAKQIVALQATLEGMAAKFPGAFEGYKLTVRESHQSTKADTSGTAKVSTAGVRSRKEQQCK